MYWNSYFLCFWSSTLHRWNCWYFKSRIWHFRKYQFKMKIFVSHLPTSPFLPWLRKHTQHRFECSASFQRQSDWAMNPSQQATVRRDERLEVVSSSWVPRQQCKKKRSVVHVRNSTRNYDKNIILRTSDIKRKPIRMFSNFSNNVSII